MWIECHVARMDPMTEGKLQDIRFRRVALISAATSRISRSFIPHHPPRDPRFCKVRLIHALRSARSDKLECLSSGVSRYPFPFLIVPYPPLKLFLFPTLHPYLVHHYDALNDCPILLSSSRPADGAFSCSLTSNSWAQSIRAVHALPKSGECGF